MSDAGRPLNPYADVATQLGLGRHWQPFPFSWGFVPGTLDYPGRPDTPVIFTVLERSQGRDCLALAMDDWRRFAYGFDTAEGRTPGLVDHLGGLVVAHEMPGQV